MKTLMFTHYNLIDSTDFVRLISNKIILRSNGYFFVLMFFFVFFVFFLEEKNRFL